MHRDPLSIPKPLLSHVKKLASSKTQVLNENAKNKNSPFYKASDLWDTLTDIVVDSDTIGVLKIKRESAVF